jgi:hypothetical protein
VEAIAAVLQVSLQIFCVFMARDDIVIKFFLADGRTGSPVFGAPGSLPARLGGGGNGRKQLGIIGVTTTIRVALNIFNKKPTFSS